MRSFKALEEVINQPQDETFNEFKRLATDIHEPKSDGLSIQTQQQCEAKHFPAET